MTGTGAGPPAVCKPANKLFGMGIVREHVLGRDTCVLAAETCDWGLAGLIPVSSLVSVRAPISATWIVPAVDSLSVRSSFRALFVGGTSRITPAPECGGARFWLRVACTPRCPVSPCDAALF